MKKAAKCGITCCNPNNIKPIKTIRFLLCNYKNCRKQRIEYFEFCEKHIIEDIRKDGYKRKRKRDN